MTFEELIKRSRSYRRFDETHTLTTDILEGLVKLTRYAPSAANLQPLKYIVAHDRQRNDLIFPTLSWAGYLKDWAGPPAGERPTGYIIILGDTRIAHNYNCDQGIAAQSILLGATEQGLGGCIIATINRPRLADALNIPEYFEILLVLALGRPVEQVQIEATGTDGSIKYYRDANGVHHVPKRPLDELILTIH